jgi:cytochrome c oxidase subunit I+III
VTTIPSEELLHSELSEAWKKPKGIISFFTDTHHTTIAKRYIVTAFIFFVIGGIEALLMRIQLARPENGFLNPDQYNMVFTMHGTTMMFLFAVPVVEAVGLYVVPLMLGTRNTAFPRLAAFSYYSYLTACLLLYVPFILGFAPDAGWFSYVPLSGPEYSPGKRLDIWAQMITFSEISGLTSAATMIATIFAHRAPGMSLNRLPLFVWSQLVTAFMVIFAMPAVMLCSTMLAMDRLVATHYFNHVEGGDALLWQHLFWFFGHPEVYTIFIPALGFISAILPAFVRRRIFGHIAMVLALVATGFIGFGLWVHHMFATGLPAMGASFFTAASIVIAIPTGVQIFCWIATMWGGRFILKTPLLWILGFFAIFVAGGLTGVMLASVPLDLQLHDTYFVVAHFHYVLIGGAVFPLLAAIHFWFPKMTGRMLSERVGKWSFWFAFIGFNVTFFPMHNLGLKGMTRRIYTYLPETGWFDLNLLATIGAFTLAIGVLLFIINVAVSLKRGAIAGDNPWNADTLEWATSSPPPPYNFLHLPTVSSRNPLWDDPPDQPIVIGMPLDVNKRTVLATRMLDAEPDHIADLPKPSITPFLLAVGSAVTFITAIFTPWGYVIGPVIAGAAAVGWFWPKGPHKGLLEEQP